MNFPGGIQIGAQAALVLKRFFIEPRVFERDGHVGAQSGEHALVLQREGVWLRALEVKNTD